ncbi:Phage integrase family protein [Bacteroides thetaiotaomicron]|nr:Phage integrase family protein [Bacteroides thetaiotaomicron]
MYERKQNGEDFFSSLAVTYSRFGNRPANGLVTEQPQYSVVVCIFSTLQNTEISLITNGLRFIYTCLLSLALAITFHCARHSFAVNILNNGANIKTVASLLGHSGLKHTEKYTRAVDKLKEEAINSLPELKF